MYNGIGLATPRGSGTNGHVQRNWALIKPKIKETLYKSEQELAALDIVPTRQPNPEILDHERKRRIELKCAEFADILEEQGFSEEAIGNKVNNYRSMLMGQEEKNEKSAGPRDKACVTETHAIAEAQQEKNARLREAFGISEYFVDGSSFDPDRQAKEKMEKSVSLYEKKKALGRAKERCQDVQVAGYELVRTPSRESSPSAADITKKKKRKRRDSSEAEESKKKRKKKHRKKSRHSKLKEKKKKKKRKANVSGKLSSCSENSDDEKKKRKKEKL